MCLGLDLGRQCLRRGGAFLLAGSAGYIDTFCQQRYIETAVSIHIKLYITRENKMNIVKKTMAWLLAATMFVTSVDYVHATETVYESQTDITTEVSQGDSAVVEVSANCIMDALSAEILYSGTEAGITWSITADGLLTIGGTYDAVSEEKVTRSWLEHKADIKKAVVTARNVEDTTEWFMGCSQLTEIDFSQFDTANVTSMTYMFYDCCALKSLNLSGFDTGKVTNMSFMFDGCSGLTSLNLKGFDTSNVTTMWYMFCDCSSLTGLDISSFDTRNVTNMAYMFDGCSKLSSLDISSFTTGNVTNMSGMFGECATLTGLDLDGFNTSNVTNMANMFDGCSGLTSLDLSSFNTGNVTKISNMFNECSGLTSLDLSNFNTGKVTNMSGMFSGCTGLTGLDLSSFDTSKVTGMSAMFYECSSLTNLDLSSFNTSKVTGMSSMFSGCKSLTGLNLSNFNTSKVTNMSRMFYECSSLTGLDLSNFDTGEVTHMSYMFDECSKLARLDLSSFNTSKLSDAKLMLSGCKGLLEFKCMPGLTLDIDLPHAMQDSEGNAYGTYLPKNLSEGIWLYAQCNRRGEVSGLEWSLFDNGVLIISGEYDATAAVVGKTLPWHEYASDITAVTIDAKGVESTAYWFAGCSMLQKVNLSQFDASKVTDMEAMFKNCYNLKRLDVSELDVSKVVNASELFLGCTNLDSLKSFKNLSVSVALPFVMYDDRATVYEECPLHITQDLWIYKRDVAGVTHGITWVLLEDGTLVLGGSDTSVEASASTTWPWHTYKNKILKVKIYTQNGKSTAYWFLDCTNMTAVDFAEFGTGNIQNMKSMFEGCTGLESLDLSTFDLSKVTTATGFLDGCSALQKIHMPANLSVDIKVPKTLYNYLGELQTDIFPKYQPEAEWYYAVNPVNEGEIHVNKVYPQTYTGKAIKPEIRIYDGANRLLDKTDFTITYKNNTKAASKDAVNTKGKSIAPTIIVKGKGNYTKEETITFDILAKNVADEDVIVSELVAVAGKKVQTPVPKLTYNGKKLVNKKDFTVSYPDMSEENPDAYKTPGTYRVVVTGIGNFVGERTLNFTIGSTLMSKVKIDKIANQSYTGSEIKPEIKVTCGKDLLEMGTDYTVCYDGNVEIGKATVTVTGMGNYVGSKTTTFRITGQSIAKAEVKGIVAKTYNGMAQTQDITVTLKGQEKPLLAGTDYDVAYTKNIDVGTATVIITGKGAYTGTIKKTFKINAYDLFMDESKLLTGVPENLTVTYEKGGSKPALTLLFAGKKLAEKKDYTVSYANNTKVTAEDAKKLPTITVKGKGNFKGSIKVPFRIIAKDLQDAENPVKISVPDMAYSKTKGKYVSKPVLTDLNGKKLVAGTDYEKTVVYTLADGTVLDKNSVVEANQIVTATVTGRGNYSGTVSATYRITVTSFKSAKIEIAAQVYTGKAITLSGEDFNTVKIGQDPLIYGEDYEIVEGSYKNNIKKGTASVTIRGKGNYGGEKTVKFKIVPKELIWFWRLFE